MREPEAEKLLAGGLRFFGRITASLSHEMNNALAVIGEVSGLAEDLIATAGTGRPPDTPKIKALLEKIGMQVRRGRAVAGHMNFLGHSTEGVRTAFDLNDAVDHLAGLSRWIAEQKGASLEALHSDGPVITVCNPFDVLQAAFLCINNALEAGAVSEPISISAVAGERGPCLNIRCADYEPEDSDEALMSYLEMLMSRMNGAVENTVSGGRRLIILRMIPAAVDAAGVP
jgi:signal transduction histidine kinase